MSPHVQFDSQPSDGERSVVDFLEQVAADQGTRKVTIAVAWARVSGLRRVEQTLRDFRRRGGNLRFIVGIDLGGASRPGLEMVESLASEAYVFHHPGGGTFHPKVILAEGTEQANLLVGSSNMTGGGLFRNYEASLRVRFNLPDEAREPALLDAVAFIDRLLSQQGTCLALSSELVRALATDGRYQLMDDERQVADANASGHGEMAPGGERSPNRFSAPAFFVKAHRDGGRPTGARSERTGERGDGDRLRRAVPSEVTSEAEVRRRWFKSLSKTDAQRLPSSSPSASVTLVTNNHPIDRNAFFREELLGDLDWVADHSTEKEVASFAPRVWIGGEDLGRRQMQVVHDPEFASGQGNRTTLLRWGDLNQTLRSQDFTAWVLTIEQLADGHHRLHLEREPTGAFVG